MLHLLTLPSIKLEVHLEVVGKNLNYRAIQVTTSIRALLTSNSSHIFPAFTERLHPFTSHYRVCNWFHLVYFLIYSHTIQAFKNKALHIASIGHEALTINQLAEFLYDAIVQLNGFMKQFFEKSYG